MSTTIKENLDSVNKLWHDFKELNDTLTDKSNKDKFDGLVLEQLNKINKAIDEQQQKIREFQAVLARPEVPNHALEKKSTHCHLYGNKKNEYNEAFCNYLRNGSEHQLAGMEYKSLTDCTQRSDNSLGYSVTSRMSEQIHDLLSTTSVMRKIAKVDEISTDALELIEDREDTDSGWSNEAENLTLNQKAVNLTKKIIVLNELYAQPKVTQRLLDDIRIDVEEWIARKLIEVFARKESDAFIHGDGHGKPRGILHYPKSVENEWGKVQHVITKGEDLTSDHIMRLFFALPERYSANAKFLMSRSALQAIRMLKDNQSNRYFWSPSTHLSCSSTILDTEVVECPDMPELGRSNTSIAIADFKSAYQIVDKPGIKILRDPYTGKPYVKYYALKMVGGDIVNFNAIKVLTLE